MPLHTPRNVEYGLGILAGLGILLRAVLTFWRVGRGTPVPLAAPRKLVVSWPFQYYRNPIMLGAICYYLGVGVNRCLSRGRRRHLPGRLGDRVHVSHAYRGEGACPPFWQRL